VNYQKQKKIVLLGMMTKMPVAGVVWQTVHYLLGFKRLGFDAYYVETHGRTPSMFMESREDNSSLKAASFISRVMSRFGFSDRWAFRALHHDDRHFGMSEQKLLELYDSAELIINLHGGTMPRTEFCNGGRLIYVETDPVQLQIELYDNIQESFDFLEPHCAFFTFGENYANPDCKLPVSDKFEFKPTRQPVVLDFWESTALSGNALTTIGNWSQSWREVVFKGETYHWSKHHEFMKFIDLPKRTIQPLELAMSSSSYGENDRKLLEENGWGLRDSLEFSSDIDAYREYIQQSYGEFTVAKDQNVRLKSGWFSDRSATYLASGRPVITQETGFSNILPTGEGLFGFSVMEEILDAIQSVKNDYERHSKAAYEIAREYFKAEEVLSRLLAEVGLGVNV